MGNKTILQCVLLQFTATLVMAVTTLVLSFGKGIAEPTTVFLSPFMLFLLLIINPIVEEVIFRKLLAQRLLKHGEFFFIFSSSFCFALVHGVSQGVPHIFYTFIIGLVLAYLYVKTGSLKLPILLHSLSNLFGAVILQLIQRVSLEVAGMYSLFLMFLGVIGLIWFIKTRK